uniref:superoxide dismutase n=1 Tax=Chrysomela lapponica TaxID=153811 RepID=A0A0S2A473_CHRLA|nr:putative copper/zinc superoxide dismutase [Chrysomela lapponica]
MFKFLLAAALATIVNAREASVFIIDPLGHEPVRGTLTFTETEHGLHIQGQINGLVPGNHGLWVNSKGLISEGCLHTGALFNPHNSPKPIGELGSINADDKGLANVDVTTTELSLEGENDIIGRTLFVNCPTAPGGGRTACGVIGIVD